MDTRTGPNGSADKHVKDIRRKTRRRFSSEEKIRIVLDGLRGESSISELCRHGGFTNGFNIKLFAMPLDGEIVIRAAKDNTDDDQC